MFQSSQFEGQGLSRTEGYATLDLGAHYDIPRHGGSLDALRILVSVRNALDADYEEVQGFPALGRNYLVGIGARF